MADKKIIEKDSAQEPLLEALQAIANKQLELSERLSEIEETIHGGKADSTLIKLANMYFNTDDKHITELSFISPLAAEPFAAALTLDAATSKEVRSSEISLNRLLIFNYLRLQRSVKGRLLGIGAEAMREQVSNEGMKGDEGLAQFEAGRE